MTHTQLSPEMEAEWKAWVESRPEVVKKMAEQFPANRVFRFKTTGHNVILYSYDENGTMTVLVLKQFNPDKIILFDRRVFGIRPEDLEEIKSK